MADAERRVTRITDPADPRIAAFVSIRERDLTGRQNRFIAEGTVVLRMLAASARAAGPFTAEAILLLESRHAGVADILAQFDDTVPVFLADAGVFNAIAGFDMHRGVLAIGLRQKPQRLADVLARLPDDALILAACGLSNHDNVGAIFRNAAAFGASAVLLDETCCDPLYRKAIRVSVGAVLTVPFVREGSVGSLLAAIEHRGFALWGLSPRGETDLDDIPPARRTALVVGAEGEGLPPAILAAIRTARIRQKPGLDSLNVATATGIALHRIAQLNAIV
ncbi:RNA methyltransferase [Rhizobium sp. Leaf384]|uniref:TrmH family RNA methyltransferase n=1 Tax=unclassified Rhizobium TaxID=2613769 RepID=UPI00071412A1|nr:MULTISPECIES: RNA methyltransferase [unclassified Rhizobium]KQS77693.1 RNA methyltransferase [Rhizobium sp. Leaf384]KQS84529.1 RNA methyltransferase [Rhizobium sp. Leaf383]